jgi:hypothetical protein
MRRQERSEAEANELVAALSQCELHKATWTPRPSLLGPLINTRALMYLSHASRTCEAQAAFNTSVNPAIYLKLRL